MRLYGNVRALMLLRYWSWVFPVSAKAGLLMYTLIDLVLFCRQGWSAPTRRSISSSRWREVPRSWKTKAESMSFTAGRLCWRTPPTSLWTTSNKVGCVTRRITASQADSSPEDVTSADTAAVGIYFLFYFNLANEVRNCIQAFIIKPSLFYL